MQHYMSINEEIYEYNENEIDEINSYLSESDRVIFSRQDAF